MSQKSLGILVIAHGSSNPKWEKEIADTLDEVKTEFPLALSYLEFTEDKTISHAIAQLENKGVNTIIAIPLFVSSGSTHIEEIKYALGVIKTSRIETDLERINHHSSIIWTDPMDDHPLILDIIVDRIHELSLNPSEEILMLVAHGSDADDFHPVWENLLTRLENKLADLFPFYKIDHGTLHPDNLKRKGETLAMENKTILALPLFLSEGYFTNKVIPERLKSIPYKWTAHTYIRHPNVSKWVMAQIESVIKEKISK